MDAYLVLHNFKKYKDKTIYFNSGLTLLVGGNNNGKSTILHAFAVWQFCKTFLVLNRGNEAILPTHRAGVGLSIEDFTPISIPNLKYLWTNLSTGSGYNLTLACYWNNEMNQEKYLTLGLSLTNDRLFIKATDSNLIEEDKTPNIAYLPPFGGIVDKEPRLYYAQRQRLIGQGQAGSVLRNTIVDMYLNNLHRRKELKGKRTKIKTADLTNLRNTDPYEILQSLLFEIFKCQVYPVPFDEQIHQYVRVSIRKGELANKRFKPNPKFNARDIMAEGSGFLQWLSVFTYALNPDVDVLLLDEPDAHLHCSLQKLMIDKLKNHVKDNKQVLIATHSVEIIKNVDRTLLMDISESHYKYVTTSKQVIGLLAGLGTEYSPMLDSIQKTKRILFVENDSDANFLRIFAKILKKNWPTNLTVWATTNKPKERKTIIEILKGQIPSLKAISLIDRDHNEYATTCNALYDKTMTNAKEKIGNIDDYRILHRKWRRSEIENYLLCKSVLARISKKSEDEIQNFFNDKAGINLPDTASFIRSDQEYNTKPIFELEGKDLINLFCQDLHCNKFDIAEEFHANEVCDDIKTMIKDIISMCE